MIPVETFSPLTEENLLRFTPVEPPPQGTLQITPNHNSLTAFWRERTVTPMELERTITPPPILINQNNPPDSGGSILSNVSSFTEGSLDGLNLTGLVIASNERASSVPFGSNPPVSGKVHDRGETGIRKTHEERPAKRRKPF